ncbi:TetR family transcriptional regulator [Clostridium acetobutylicum]|nr:TetR family transcriptional regulator [Clostridium acetobutylicum]
MQNIETKRNTKQKIFEAAAKLFAKEGYNGVSMRQIAREVGIRESSIYNHYKNKEEILSSLFDYFVKTLTKCRPTEEEIEKMLDYMSVEDVFKQLIIGVGKSLNGTLNAIARIVYMEQFRNEKAKTIMLENLIEEPSEFAARVLKIMHKKNLIKDVDIELIAHEYNYTLLAITFEYSHAVSSNQDTAPIIKKMFNHVGFIYNAIKY